MLLEPVTALFVDALFERRAQTIPLTSVGAAITLSGGRPIRTRPGDRTWFVVEPGVQSLDQLPGIGTPMVVETPNGVTLRTHLSDRAVRHGSAAFRFGDPELNELPRLAVVKFAG